MVFRGRIPSKTFVLGEYLVLRNHRALLVATAPYFQLTARKNMDSTSPRTSSSTPCELRNFERLREWRLLLDAPVQTKGGFGASTAKWLWSCLVEARLHGATELDLKSLLVEYREKNQTN